MSSTTAGNFVTSNKLFAYIDGAFQSVDIAATKVAVNYLSSDTSGIMIADMNDGYQVPSEATGRNVFINNTSVNIRDATTPLAKFDADEIRLGKYNNNYLSVSNNSIDVYHNNEELVHFGYGQNQGEASTENSPYFNLGRREQNTSNGAYSIIEGNFLEASGWCSYAQGYGNVANKQCAHAEGKETTASGIMSHSEGRNTVASGEVSHAEGTHTTASGVYSHAEGMHTLASNHTAHAEGNYTTASGTCSHAEGDYTIASSSYQHVQGKYNIEDANNKYAFIIGNGTEENDVITRSNALTVDWSGNVVASGDLTANGGLIGDSLECNGIECTSIECNGDSKITGRLTSDGNSGLFTLDTASIVISSIGTYASCRGNIDITKSGYTPIAIAGFGITGDNGWCVFPRCYITKDESDSTIDYLNFYIWNQNSKVAFNNVTIEDNILYIASSAF